LDEGATSSLVFSFPPISGESSVAKKEKKIKKLKVDAKQARLDQIWKLCLLLQEELLKMNQHLEAMDSGMKTTVPLKMEHPSPFQEPNQSPRSGMGLTKN
jgi:hypothetical protein